MTGLVQLLSYREYSLRSCPFLNLSPEKASESPSRDTDGEKNYEKDKVYCTKRNETECSSKLQDMTMGPIAYFLMHNSSL